MRLQQNDILVFLSNATENSADISSMTRFFSLTRKKQRRLIKLLRELRQEGKIEKIKGRYYRLRREGWSGEKVKKPEERTERKKFYNEDELLKVYQIQTEFNPRTLAELDHLPSPIEDLRGMRLDLRSEKCFTIDPAEARDHDDAVSIRRTGEREIELGVHIADVSFYVKENSSLDKTAFQRGTSLYLPTRVIPMLPEKLSNDLCSLTPGSPKLTLSCIMTITEDGQVKRYRIVPTLIESKANLTYEDVEKILDQGDQTHPLYSELKEMLALSEILRNKKLARGAIDLEIPEPQFKFNAQGEVESIALKKRLKSHRLIEEFMLMANETVTRHMKQRSFLYRVHDQPDPEKIHHLIEFLKSIHFPYKVGLPLTPKKFQKIIEKASGTPFHYLVNDTVLRSLKKAEYSHENIGHFGLACPYYTHFTSPIRRYPDLVVHRHLKSALKISALQDGSLEHLRVIGKQTSERERVALEVEREAIKFRQVEFISGKLGEIYYGVIAGIIRIGFFVMIDENLVEGLVLKRYLKDGFYWFDEKRQQLVGEQSGRIFKIGDRVKVQVARVDRAARKIDFELLEKL